MDIFSLGVIILSTTPMVSTYWCLPIYLLICFSIYQPSTLCHLFLLVKIIDFFAYMLSGTKLLWEEFSAFCGLPVAKVKLTYCTSLPPSYPKFPTSHFPRGAFHSSCNHTPVSPIYLLAGLDLNFKTQPHFYPLWENFAEVFFLKS